MSEYYGGNRPPRRDYDGRPVGSGNRRPQGGSGYANSSRSAQNRRPSQSGRPQSGRPVQNPNRNGRRPAPKRRRRNPAPKIILILLVVALIIGGVFFLPKLFKSPQKDQTTTVQANVVTVTPQPDIEESVSSAGYSSLADYLNDEDTDVQGLTEDQMIDVASLSINESLPEEWLNVLLLGTDARNPSESARSDTMIICSINKNTGEVKLTSIMRDLAVELNDLGKNSGTYRINSANYFGGPEYAMKVVNECFDMNIQYYVSINFYGFQDIAHALGGITVDITEEEMVEINRYVWNAHRAAEVAGVEDTETIPLVELTEYGKGVQLDGRQTLAYARIRKTDNDYARTGRQRETLGKLAAKLKEKSTVEVIMLLTNFVDYVETNMEITEASTIALTVLQGDISNIEGFRLPIEGTYESKTVNEKSMLYDCDWNKNATELYTFIYN